jgi:DNA-binding transcriptional LysR family regulator
MPRAVEGGRQADPPDLYRRLDARKVDLVIVRMSGLVSEEKRHTEVLYDEPVVVAAGLQHPHARKRRVKLADVADELWALPRADGFIHALVTEAFCGAGLGKPRISVVAQSHYLRLTLASRGPFLTVVPKGMIPSSMGQLSIKALPIELPGNRRPVGIVTLKNRTLSPVAQLFIQHTRTIAAMTTKG